MTLSSAKTQERRQEILRLLAEGQPLTGQELARQFGVSRQVIVQDIAVLRAGGTDIISTPQGYLLAPFMRPETVKQRLIACRHDLEGMRRELYIIVDCGGKVVDVIVEHPVYGELRGYLMLASRRDVDRFWSRLTNSGAQPLYTLTSTGVHLHTITADDEQVLNEIEAALAEEGLLIG